MWIYTYSPHIDTCLVHRFPNLLSPIVRVADACETHTGRDLDLNLQFLIRDYLGHFNDMKLKTRKKLVKELRKIRDQQERVGKYILDVVLGEGT